MPPAAAPRSRRFTRRTLFRLAAGGAVAGFSLETARVLAGGNEHTVIPGKVYRSAQLTQEKLQRVIAEKKIRTVINLRGCCPDMGWYMGDARATNATGISQEDLTFSAKRLPAPGRAQSPHRGVRPHGLPRHTPLRRRGRPHRAREHNRASVCSRTTTSRPRGGRCGRGTGTSRSAAPDCSTSSSTTTQRGSRRPANRTRRTDSGNGSRNCTAPDHTGPI